MSEHDNDPQLDDDDRTALYGIGCVLGAVLTIAGFIVAAVMLVVGAAR